MARLKTRLVLPLASLSIVLLIGAVLLVWQGDILQALLDPKLPYAVYRPPPAPDFAQSTSWALLPDPLKRGDPPTDVFFVHPTTFDGGRDWNAPIMDRGSARLLAFAMLPNYAAPFASVGRVFAPRYRQASLYSSLTLFDDAVEAREFPYGDVEAAFRSFVLRIGPSRPFMIVGVEQGGGLAARLLSQVVMSDPLLRRRLVAAYLIETATPADEHGTASRLPVCNRPAEAGCLVAWISAPWLDFGRTRRIMNRSLVWSPKGRLVGLAGRAPVCVNPILGGAVDADAPSRLNRGAANAAGLEWGARPGFLTRQVGARCVGGILRVTSAKSASLRPSGGWAKRLRVPSYNLFWADLEADAQSRAAAFGLRHQAMGRVASQSIAP